MQQASLSCCRRPLVSICLGDLSSKYTSWKARDVRVVDQLRHLTTDQPHKPAVTKGFWNSVKNQRAFLTQLGEELGITHYSEWYKVSRAEVSRRGGYGLWKRYNSLKDALMTIFPDQPWDVSRFPTQAAAGFWKNKIHLFEALSSAEQKLGIQQVEDWYSIAASDLKDVGFPSTITKLKLVQLLNEKYPNHKWEQAYLLRGRYAQQRRLEKAITQLFPNLEVKTNVRKDADLVNPLTGAYLELDVYIPSLKLAFEYQDLHHYKSAQYAYQPVEMYQSRDTQKKQLAKAKGITLVIIPCWWDGKFDSLVATLKEVCPEYMQAIQAVEGSTAIPTEMPPYYIDSTHKVFHVEDIGEPTTACFLTGTKADPTNWWMFEKYDGVRAFWNPLKKQFYSRRGNTLALPQEVIETMPTDIFLDGELWFGEDNFEEASKISKKMDFTAVDWKKFKYMVFDVPNGAGSYEDRYSMLENRFHATLAPYIAVAPKRVCKGTAHLEEFFQDVIDKGGEGIILRNPRSPYEPGRSAGYLKHKKFRDAEAKIVECIGPGQWTCILPNGVTFTGIPGTSEFLKRWAPKAGDIVSFKHRGFMAGSKKPKFPALYRLRPDLAWQNVVDNWKQQKVLFTGLPMKRKTKSNRPLGFWKNVANWRKFFCDFATEKGFDPLVADNWTTITRKPLLVKGAGTMFSKHKSLKAALRAAFPELEFKFKGQGYWSEGQNLRPFFDKFASQQGFDSNNPENWYSVQGSNLLQQQFGPAIRHYNKGFQNALRKAYPELPWKEGPWKVPEPSPWRDVQRVRQFFDDFAQEKGFDPLVPDNWYHTSTKQFHASKGGRAIQERWGGMQNALRHAYPDMSFKPVWRSQVHQ